MHGQLNLIRAIGSEFIVRKVRPVLLIAGIVMVVVVALTVWLITRSAWWWLLLIPLGIIAAIGLVAYVLFRALLGVIWPQLSTAQAGSVRALVDKLERVTETIGTPLPFIILKVALDVIRPGHMTFIQTVAADSTTLHSDYLQLHRTFEKSD